jgi:hypothetical protein
MYAVRERVLKSFFPQSVSTISIRDGVCGGDGLLDLTLRPYVAKIKQF